MDNPEAVAWLESEGMIEQRAADSGGGFGVEAVLQHCAGLNELTRHTEAVRRLEGLPDFSITLSGTFGPDDWARISEAVRDE